MRSSTASTLPFNALPWELRPDLPQRNYFLLLTRKSNTAGLEAVNNNINTTHYSPKAWETVNQLTGLSAPPHKCPISANSIASQLVNDGVLENKDHEFTRLMVKDISD